MGARFEVEFECTLWGNIRDFREVVALAENERIGPIEIEPVRFEGMRKAFERMRAGDVKGRYVLTL